MSRYIDADALIVNMRGAFIDHVEEFRAITIVEDAPSIDIVRCRECEHGTWHEQTEMYICSANDQDLYEAEHFCSYGERREP